MQQLTPAWAYLASIHPALPWATIPLVLWLSVAATRRWLPSVWAFLERLGPAGKLATKAWQAAPSAAGGALLAALSGQGDYRGLILGALAGLFAPVWHEMLATWAAVRVEGRLPLAAAPDPKDVVTPSGPVSPTPQPENPILRGPSPPGVTTLLLLSASLAGSLAASGCKNPPDPCTPAALTWAKRSAGAGVILAGECDEGKLEACEALAKADLVAEAYRTACGSSSAAIEPASGGPASGR